MDDPRELILFETSRLELRRHPDPTLPGTVSFPRTSSSKVISRCTHRGIADFQPSGYLLRDETDSAVHPRYELDAPRSSSKRVLRVPRLGDYQGGNWRACVSAPHGDRAAAGRLLFSERNLVVQIADAIRRSSFYRVN